MPKQHSQPQYLKLGKYLYLKDRDILLSFLILCIGHLLTEGLHSIWPNMPKALLSLLPLSCLVPFFLALIGCSFNNLKQSRAETKVSRTR